VRAGMQGVALLDVSATELASAQANLGAPSVVRGFE